MGNSSSKSANSFEPLRMKSLFVLFAEHFIIDGSLDSRCLAHTVPPHPKQSFSSGDVGFCWRYRDSKGEVGLSKNIWRRESPPANTLMLMVSTAQYDF